jgi:competence protein ComEA
MKKLVSAVMLAITIAVSPVIAFADDANSGIQIIDINSAESERIAEVLEGVGLSKAEAIVAYRQVHGDFKSAEELIDVKGIGEKTVDANRAKIRFN